MYMKKNGGTDKTQHNKNDSDCGIIQAVKYYYFCFNFQVD